MKKLIAAAGLAVAIALGAAACIPAADPWQALDTGPEAGQTGWTPDAPQNPAVESRVVDNRNVDLLWRPRRPNQYLGTAVETSNLGLAVEDGDVVTVRYFLSSSISQDPGNEMPASGAVRLFLYLGETGSTPGHRPNSAPTWQVAAPQGPTSGTLTINVDQDGTIGYAGLSYDTSNGGVQGRVRFRDLKVNDQLVLFE